MAVLISSRILSCIYSTCRIHHATRHEPNRMYHRQKSPQPTTHRTTARTTNPATGPNEKQNEPRRPERQIERSRNETADRDSTAGPPNKSEPDTVRTASNTSSRTRQQTKATSKSTTIVHTGIIQRPLNCNRDARRRNERNGMGPMSRVPMACPGCIRTGKRHHSRALLESQWGDAQNAQHYNSAQKFRTATALRSPSSPAVTRLISPQRQ